MFPCNGRSVEALSSDYVVKQEGNAVQRHALCFLSSKSRKSLVYAALSLHLVLNDDVLIKGISRDD